RPPELRHQRRDGAEKLDRPEPNDSLRGERQIDGDDRNRQIHPGDLRQARGRGGGSRGKKTEKRCTGGAPGGRQQGAEQRGGGGAGGARGSGGVFAQARPARPTETAGGAPLRSSSPKMKAGLEIASAVPPTARRPRPSSIACSPLLTRIAAPSTESRKYFCG